MNRRQQDRLFRQLEDKYSREVAEAFRAVIQEHADSINLTALARAIDAGDMLEIEALLGFDQGRLFPLSEAIRNAFIAGGLSVAQTSGLGAVFGFDGRHDRALNQIDRITGRLVEGIKSDTLVMVQGVVRAGIEAGTSGAKVARQITGTQNAVTGRREGGFLGLNSQQTDAAIRARAELQNLDRAYFGRKLRNRNFDAMVRKAIETGKPLSQADLDRVANAYKDRLLAYRGKVIARTEAHTALAKGAYEGYTQLEDAGLGTVTKIWIHGFSSDFRPTHLSAAQAPARRLREPWLMEEGLPMQHPHDEAGGAVNSINCKCHLFYRVQRG